MNTHPVIKYGIAVVMRDNNLTKIEDITRQHLLNEIEHSLHHFRVRPEGFVDSQKTIKYDYCNEKEGNTSLGVYLSPSILSENKGATKVYLKLNQLREELKKGKQINIDVTRSITPVVGAFNSFGKSVSKINPKTSLETAIFCIITTTTEKKPCFNYKTWIKNKISGKFDPVSEPTTIIPDLEVDALLDFINIFEIMRGQSTRHLMYGDVREIDKKPLKPRIFEGNFPNAPRCSSLGVIGLLGSIGSWAKEAEMHEWASKVLDSLKGKPIYLIGTDTFQTCKYNHFIIDLAKETKLSSIIDSIYYTTLYNQKPRYAEGDRLEYQKFDLFTARFLQLFNTPAFKDFLSFRAEYPSQLEILFKTYFENMENITSEVVQSARELGRWLNYAAYKVANTSIEKSAKDRTNKVREQKAKTLIEIESSIFSARSGDALIFQAITRAGRASGLDAPAEADLFMEKVATGDVSLDKAKHLLIAFSRIRNKYEPKPSISEEDSSGQEESDGDFSDGQE